MEFTLAEYRRKRAAIKGNITKISTQVRTLRDIDVQKLSVSQIKKQADLLEKADEAFVTQHQIIYELDNELDHDKYMAELMEHQSTITTLQMTLDSLEEHVGAVKLLKTLKSSLATLELCTKDGYESYMSDRLDKLQERFAEFEIASALGDAGDSTELQWEKDEATTRLMALEQLRERARPEASPTHSTLTAVMPITNINGPKISFPTFDGTILNWRDFWHLFSSLLKKYTGLTDEEKNCHLVKAMGTPESQKKAKSAVACSDTFEQVVAKMKATYENNKVLHMHHLEDMLQPDVFKDEKHDYERMKERILQNVRGMKLAKGYTADQVFCAHFQRHMSPTAVRRWKDWTAEQSDPPSVDELLKFLERQIQSTTDAPLVKRHKEAPPRPKQPPPTRSTARTVLSTQTTTDKCFLCNSEHMLYTCPQFQEMTPAQRNDLVKSSSLCYNCLGSNHRSPDCHSSRRCKTCSGKHHSLIHLPKRRADDTREPFVPTVNLTNRFSATEQEWKYSLPSTAIVTLCEKGLMQKARAQLDSGANTSLISRRLAASLQAPKIPNSRTRIVGVSGILNSPHRVQVTLIGNSGEEVVVGPHVVDEVPHTPSLVDIKKIHPLPFLAGLELADPGYNSSSRIDLLLSSLKSNACFRQGVRFSADQQLKAENTIFGWAVTGADSDSNQERDVTPTCMKVSVQQEDEPDQLMRKLWELEQTPAEESTRTSDERKAIEHFDETMQRDEDGRYRVSLPRKTPTPELGRSRETALRIYVANEQSLKKKGVWEVYHQAVDDYCTSHHAELVPAEDLRKGCKCVFYLPMHGVIKASSSTTKMRPSVTPRRRRHRE